MSTKLLFLMFYFSLLLIGCSNSRSNTEYENSKKHNNIIRYLKNSDEVQSLFTSFYKDPNVEIQFSLVKCHFLSDFSTKGITHVHNLNSREKNKIENKQKRLLNSLKDLIKNSTEESHMDNDDLDNIQNKKGEWFVSIKELDQQIVISELFYLSNNNYIKSPSVNYYFGSTLNFIFLMDKENNIERVFYGNTSYN